MNVISMQLHLMSLFVSQLCYATLLDCVAFAKYNVQKKCKCQSKAMNLTHRSAHWLVIQCESQILVLCIYHCFSVLQWISLWFLLCAYSWNRSLWMHTRYKASWHCLV